MRYILIILVFLSVGANAQMVIKAHANYRPYAQPSANLLLDDYPNAAAAYSLRKLDKDYTGACIRIRRTDNSQETDIGFVNNYLDTTTIKNFTGSGTSAVVVTWFDQSGNGRNASQSVAANQPAIMNANFEFATIDAVISSEKAISFGTTSARLIANFTTISQPISAFAYARKDNVTTAAAGTIYDSYNNTQSILYYTGTSETTNNRWTLASGTGLQGTTAGNTNPNLFSTLHNGASSYIKINGVDYVSGNAGTNGLNGLAIGNLRGNPSPIVSGYVLGGRIGELIIYGSDQSTNRTAIENNINDYYNIYWNGDFTGILDTYPNSAAAYSLRNLSSTYTGPLIRVRKDTTGQPEMDIYGDYYGNLDTVGLKNFLLTRSGFVTTWYDQSGNSGRNASQATQANQPRIANLGVIERDNGKVAINYNATTQHLGFTAYDVTTEHLIITVNNFSVTGKEIIGHNTNGKYMIFRDASLAYYALFSSGFQDFGATISINQQILQVDRYQDGALNRLSLYENGGGQVGGIDKNPSPNTSTTINNLSGESSTWYFQGTMQEVLIWTGNKSSNRTGIRNALNTYYGIY